MIIEIGYGFFDGIWEKIIDGGYIVFFFEEWEKLIKVLEFYWDVYIYEIGDFVGVGFEVVVV